MAEVSIVNPVYFPLLESCFADYEDAILGCVDPDFAQIFYTTDIIRFQARQPISEVGQPLLVTVAADVPIFATQTTEDVGDFRIYDFEFDPTAYAGQTICFVLGKVTGFLELETVDSSWPIKIVEPPENQKCQDYRPNFSYTDCGGGPDGHYWGSVGERNYNIRLPVTISSSSYASTISATFSSLGPGKVCNSIHTKTLGLGTYEFIPEWLANKIQIIASLNNFKVEGTKYFLASDLIRADASGFGTFNYEISLTKANQLRKSLCC